MQGFGFGVGAACGGAYGAALRVECGHDEQAKTESASKQTKRVLHVARFIYTFNLFARGSSIHSP